MTGVEFLLLPIHLFGRHALHPYTSLKGDNISRQHALLSWDGISWLLEDTSANGTFLNAERLKKDYKFTLDQGDIINFGGYDSTPKEQVTEKKPSETLSKDTPAQSSPPLEELRQAALDISLYLYCHGIARQTTKKITGSIIKPLCRKDGGKPYGTVDVNVWKAWIAGSVKFPQVNKLDTFCHYLLKEFPIIQHWSTRTKATKPSLPLTIEDKQLIIQVAKNLRSQPERALDIWKQKNSTHRLKLKFNTLPSEAKNRQCFSWLRKKEANKIFDHHTELVD